VFEIAPSILSADFSRLAEEIRAIEEGGATVLHVDVMDGHFVPNITIGPPVVRAIKHVAARPLDVHLMIENAERYVDAFVDAGAAMLSVHVETEPHLHRVITHIKERGAKAGAALSPSTPAVTLEAIAGELDFVVVMSVNPGFGGQTFIRSSIDKLHRVREVLWRAGSSVPIEIDGGIDDTNAAEVVAAGASILVAGHAIFGGGDPESATRALRAASTSAAGSRA
jgi:ribulose-phosphate 3-epimerase